MDERRVRLLRRVYQCTLGLAGVEVGAWVVGDAYTLVYRYSRCNTNFLGPQEDDASPRATALQVLLCNFVLAGVESRGPFITMTLGEPEVVACTHEDDMQRMRVYLCMTGGVFTCPASTIGRDVRMFERTSLAVAIE